MKLVNFAISQILFGVAVGYSGTATHYNIAQGGRLLVVLKRTHGAANLWTVQSLKKANIVALQPMEQTSGLVQNAVAAQMIRLVEKQDNVKAAATLVTVRLGVQLVLLMDAQIQQDRAAGDSELLAETQSHASHPEPAL